jgi:hypothetical protein
MPPRTRRTRGSIGQLPSGSYRVTVYAGSDPLTGKMRQLRRTVKTYDEARKELTKLQRQVDEDKREVRHHRAPGHRAVARRGRAGGRTRNRPGTAEADQPMKIG